MCYFRNPYGIQQHACVRRKTDSACILLTIKREVHLISVVIITKNEQDNIVDCIQSARQISGDIIVVDSGSTDRTLALARAEGARVIPVSWNSYGDSRNVGAAAAHHNWIFALDADERIDARLAGAINALELSDRRAIYRFRRDNYYGSKKLRFGSFSVDKAYRLYNRANARWDLTPVHEELVYLDRLHKTVYTGRLCHYGIRDTESFCEKMRYYAILSAQKYYQQGKRPTVFKRFGSPLFNALKSYIFQLGFLDGREGWIITWNIAYYSWLKYNTQTVPSPLKPAEKPLPLPILEKVKATA